MTTLVLQVASVAGLVVAGPAGGLVGAAIGSVIDRSVFVGGGSVREGPRLSDLSVQSSALGETIPLVFGTARVSGNVIWSSGLIEKRSEEKQSGGKGRKSTSTVTFSYSVSLAVGLGARPIQGVRRIWADGKLLRDEAGRWLSPATLRVYQGTETQNPDVLIEAHEGIANAPAFRGMAYAVLEGLELAEFANRVPNLSFEVIADDAVSAGDLLVEIAARSGVETAQATGLDQSVEGLALARDVPCGPPLKGLWGFFRPAFRKGAGCFRSGLLMRGTNERFSKRIWEPADRPMRIAGPCILPENKGRIFYRN